MGESGGDFLFTKSIEDSLRATDYIQTLHPTSSLCLVGHSWGGMMAMKIAEIKGEKIEKLVLLSPLCSLSREEPLYNWLIEGVRTDIKGIFAKLEKDEVDSDLTETLRQCLPEKVVANLSPQTKVTFIQALQDDITPPDRARNLIPSFSSKPHYIELDLDHSFNPDRRLLARTVIEALKRDDGV